MSLLIISVLFLYACGIDYNPEEETEAEISKSDPVLPDGTLETVTWNLEWYGDKSYGSGNNGPDDEGLQRKNIIRITDSLEADLYAFQEVYSQQALSDITEYMSDYNGFVADHINWIQKTAFVYNTNTIDSLAAGPITNEQDEHAWANGRFPLYFRFNYRYDQTVREFYAIVIHAKAFDDQKSYERRKEASQDLYDYLIEQKPNTSVILLGDYNDDVDLSIHNDEESPYQPFVESDNYQIVTKILSDMGKSSTARHADMIDHITMSDELFPLYMNESAAVFEVTQEFIPDYEHTTSDHYPVWAKFVVQIE